MEKQLPKNWVETKLKEILFYIIGGDWGKDPESINDDDFIEVLCIRGSEIKNWTKNKGNTASLRKIKKNSLENRKLKFGDILVEISGGGPDQPVGRTVFIDKEVLEFESETPKVCTNFLRLIRVHDNLNSKFINHYLQYFYNSGEITKYQGGSNNLRNLKFKEYETISVPLPPLAEQNRIVAKLDILFAQLESIKTRIANLKDISNRFTYSCLIDLKNSNFHERKKIGQYLEERTDRIGANWKNLRLIGVSAKEGITNLRVGQKESFEKYKIVRPGDFIYNTMRVNIGSIAIYDGTENALTSPDYVVFRVSKHLSSRLLLNFLKSDQGLLEIGANTKGSVRARLYFKALSEIRMPIAPIKVQNFAENFLKGFNITLNSLNNLKQTSLDKLSPSILEKTFKGELVPQLDNDGHANELLQQIKELKDQAIKTKKK